jgi:hypothetical protein
MKLRPKQDNIYNQNFKQQHFKIRLRGGYKPRAIHSIPQVSMHNISQALIYSNNGKRASASQEQACILGNPQAQAINTKLGANSSMTAKTTHM